MWALISILHPSSQSTPKKLCEVSLVTPAVGDTLSPSIHPGTLRPAAPPLAGLSLTNGEESPGLVDGGVTGDRRGGKPLQALTQRREEESNSRAKGCYESSLLVQPFLCGMPGMAGGAEVCLTPPRALDSSEHQPRFCSPPSPTAVTPITHEQRCPKAPGQCSVFPASCPSHAWPH